MWHSRRPRDPPPFHCKYHLKFPFWLLEYLPKSIKMSASCNCHTMIKTKCLWHWIIAIHDLQSTVSYRKNDKSKTVFMGTAFDKNGVSHLSIMVIALSWSFAEGWFMAQGTDASLMWYDGLKEVRSEWLISDFWIPLYQTDWTLSSAELFLLYFLRPCMSKIKCLFVLKITTTV